MQCSTLSHSIKKTEFPGKDRGTRLTLRQVRLNGRALLTLQLTVEIQRQPSTYVFTTSQTFLLTSFSVQSVCPLCLCGALYQPNPTTTETQKSQTALTDTFVCQRDNRFLSFPRARPNLDITVPAGQSST